MKIEGWMKTPLRHLLQGARPFLPEQVKRLAWRALRTTSAMQARLRLTVGVQPLSQRGGFDRGTPIHRHYLEQFLQEFSSDICGHCLEFQEDSYTSRFGADKVTRLDILHKDNDNKNATLVADLTRPNNI